MAKPKMTKTAGYWNSDPIYKWRLYNKLHRRDGPALVTKGLEGWYLKGLKHRTDGPAVIIGTVDGGEIVEYWIKGKQMSEVEFFMRQCHR